MEPVMYPEYGQYPQENPQSEPSPAGYPQGGYPQAEYTQSAYSQPQYTQGGYPQQSYPYAYYPQAYPAAPTHGRARRPIAALAAAGLLTVAGTATATVAAMHAFGSTNGTGSTASGQQLPSANGGTGGYGSGGYGTGGTGGYGSGGSGSSGSGGPFGSSGNGTQISQQSATAAQQVGVVDINTVLGYQGAQAAGTGMVLTSTGEILTNNHVVSGATKISVTIVSTGAQYSATVVGTDPTQDVAVIQLSGASGLPTAAIGDSNSTAVGDQVTAVGNAGGVGGTPSAATGSVTGLDKSITASDENGADSQHLTGLIETDAGIQAGDSGGPLYNASGKIIGMDTAASSNGSATDAYAIPIDTALSIANQIEGGNATSTVHIGLPAFLGVSLSEDTGSGAVVSGVASGTPAATIGLAAGDVITAIDGTSVTSDAGLKAALGKHHPGDSVSVTWTDQSGSSHTAKATLVAGPAD
jgi:S1-C subfamily serine protease